ncbi:MAG: prepilin-type N-terminal cleavage/methylation domain-containing protein [Planctomycetes bacterium]|nr:prepilin-type N-terminal cleavage/methylation domain-containing protein [Planctomycetota bacterium]MCB9935138.1 prepilin-type N-terminal cleavage/methylation domain-containing protein [Planctomycetota bacterium]
MKRQGSHKRGFTLMELLVVIAIVAMLVTVMVPVMLKFMKGRGLSMSGNNIGGFIAFARSEAMNTRQTHVIVCYTQEEELPGQSEAGLAFHVGPGLALYRLNANPAPGTDEQEINYVKQLDFRGQIGGDVEFAPRWIAEAPTGPIDNYLSDAANTRFNGKYKVAVLADGRLIIPQDKPGYVLDSGETMNLNTDLILTDNDRFVYIDLNPTTGAVKRSLVLDREEVSEP